MISSLPQVNINHVTSDTNNNCEEHTWARYTYGQRMEHMHDLRAPPLIKRQEDEVSRVDSSFADVDGSDDDPTQRTGREQGAAQQHVPRRR